MNHEIVDSFAAMAREKGIDRDILIGIVEDIFGMMVKKKYGLEARYDIVVNMDKGDIEIYLEKDVVETVEDPVTQISPKEVKEKSGETLDAGDEYVEIIPLVTFGRRLVISAKQNLNQRIREIERETIYNEYSGSLGEIVVGEIYQIRRGRGEILVMHNKTELVLPRSEQIYKERYKKGDTIRAVVKEVRKGSGNPTVIISRTDPQFLMRLFEVEIPEIYDGIIEIKRIAREPGDRAKVAVLSHDERIDAVGACVGMKGVRIHAIVRELNNENIDVINYAEDPVLFLTRAMSPAKLKEVQVDIENKKATVVVANDQVSLAIGRNGQNVRLASKLTALDVQVLKEAGEEEEYDMDLSEFREELGDVLFHKFFDEGYETVRDVTEAPREDLINNLAIDPEKIDEILTMLRSGLEEAEVEEEEGEFHVPAVGEVEAQVGINAEAPADEDDTPEEQPAAADEVSDGSAHDAEQDDTPGSTDEAETSEPDGERSEPKA